MGVILVLTVQWILAEKAGEKSSFALLSQINLFRLLFPYGWMRQYLNLRIGPWVIPRHLLILLAMGVGVLLAMVVICGIILYRRPVRKAGAWKGLLTHLEEKKNHLLEILPPLCTEGYKLLLHQRMWIILCFVLWVSFQNYKTTGVIYTDLDGNYQEYFYQHYTGELSEETKQYAADIQEQLEEQYAALSMEENNQMLNDSIRLNEKRLLFVQEQIQYLEFLRDERNIRGWIMDERGYETMLGNRNNESQMALGAVSFMAVLMCGSLLFSQEKKNGTWGILNSTGGRMRLVFRKYLVLIIYVSIVWTFTYGINLYNMYQVYELGDGQAPVQSLRILRDFPFHISVRSFVIGLYFMRWVVLCCAACMAAMFSTYLGYYQSIIFSMLLLLPHAFDFFGWEQWEELSLVRAAAFQQLWFQYGNSWQLWLKYGVILALGCVSILIPFRTGFTVQRK